MTMDQSAFRMTWLWRQAFVNPIPGVSETEQAFFRDRFLQMRDRAETLVAQIAAAMPGLTVHDITHLDALWETASLVTEGAITISPAEAFVFGASVLLHDSAMSLAAYPNGLSDLQNTIQWKDTVALLTRKEGKPAPLGDPSEEIIRQAIPEVLRRLHAEQASALATLGWQRRPGEIFHLIDHPETRAFYGTTIGQIAHSHWWSASQVERDLAMDLGPYPGFAQSRIDKVKVACLLRLADALHLDARRAPLFLRSLVQPTGVSALHWTFQERLAFPIIEHESVVFSSTAPFDEADSDAWWLAYDTLCAVDKELQDVDVVMHTRNRGMLFRARRLRGAGSPETMSRSIPTKGWRPIDTHLRASDIPALVETLGGEKLYGDDSTVAVRELIQNAADAVEARRRLEDRGRDWGLIKVALEQREDGLWLSVEDNGTGMSERVLTGPLIDFGTSFWRSSLATTEFPGLAASGMESIGRFGIGFFSVFMLGKKVRVISRRYDQGMDAAHVLEFREGTSSRPILMPIARGGAPLDGGTRVEVLLKQDPRLVDSSAPWVREQQKSELVQVIAHLAPSISVTIATRDESDDARRAVLGDDWFHLKDVDLWDRLHPKEPWATTQTKKSGQFATFEPLLNEVGEVVGRAFIAPPESSWGKGGWVTVGGLRASQLSNIQGVLIGRTLTAARDRAIPIVSSAGLATWASAQASSIARTSGDELYKARCAEVVLECGGDIGDLPIVRRGVDEWLSSKEFCELIVKLDELLITFDGEFSYEEDEDNVLPREFREGFEIGAEVFVVPRHDGTVLRHGSRSWPDNGRGSAGRSENLSKMVASLIQATYGENCDEGYEKRQIGEVGSEPIERDIKVYRMSEADDEG